MNYYKWTSDRTSKSGRAAVFLDRDGVINHDYGYISDLSRFKLISGSLMALKLLCQSNYRIIIVTNQSGIGRGYFTYAKFSVINDEMIKLFHKNSIDIDAIFMCPHHPNFNCECRKPRTKMLLDAIDTYDLLVDDCYIVGDKLTDIEAGERVGIQNRILIKQNDGQALKDVGDQYRQVESLYDATEIILGLSREKTTS